MVYSKGSFICTIPQKDSTYHGLCYTSRGALAGTRNSSMGPPHEGSTMTTHRTLLPHYMLLLFRIVFVFGFLFLLFVCLFVCFGFFLIGARCSSMVIVFTHGAMGHRSFMSYFSFQPIHQDWCKDWPLYVISCLWDDAYKITLAANRKE